MPSVHVGTDGGKQPWTPGDACGGGVPSANEGTVLVAVVAQAGLELRFALLFTAFSVIVNISLNELPIDNSLSHTAHP